MITMRKGEDRGYFDHGWLKTYHTFSFGNYYDPDHMGFRSLRVINEDRVAPKQGFPPHAHQNMEIISFVLEGSLAHTDSLGHTSTLKAGEIQVMSVGTGVKHAEFNPSNTEEVHFLNSSPGAFRGAFFRSLITHGVCLSEEHISVRDLQISQHPSSSSIAQA